MISWRWTCSPRSGGGIYRASAWPVHRLGLALEPWPKLLPWIEQQGLEALWLHRPWGLELTSVPSHVGVLAYHLAFDERLTLGWNLRLAAVLNLSGVEVLGYKEGRAIGMLGNVPRLNFAEYQHQIAQVFGGQEAVWGKATDPVERVAVVGAMTAALVQEAADRGAQVYVTGQIRQPAVAAIAATGINLIAVGHRRSEAWGLRALAGVLQERWFGLSVVVRSPEVEEICIKPEAGGAAADRAGASQTALSPLNTSGSPGPGDWERKSPQ